MKRIYIGTLVSKEEEPKEGMPSGMPQPQSDKVIIAENVTEVEAIVGQDYNIERLVHLENWMLTDDVEKKKGIFYLVNTKYFDEVKDKIEAIEFFVRAETFSEIEKIISEECGETFRFILSIEKSPYEVLGV